MSILSFDRRLQGIQSDWKAALEAWDAHHTNDRNNDDDHAFEAMKEAIVAALTDTCQVVREAADQPGLSPEALSDFVKRAADMEHEVVDFTYNEDEEFYDFIPVFCGNFVEDKSKGIAIGHDIRDFVGLLFGMASRSGGSAVDKDEMLREVLGSHAEPYDPSLKPSAHTTPLARFRDSLPPIPSNAPAAFRALSEARCEITSSNTSQPSRVAVSDSVVAVIGSWGYKDRDPSLEVWNKQKGLVEDHQWITPGLVNIAYDLVLDEARRLVMIADDQRIKTYEWSTAKSKVSLLPKHTMKSKGFEGPLASLDNGRLLVRAGEKKLAFWDVDAAATHGPNGRSRVGKKMTGELDTMRDLDDADGLELSSGSKVDRTVNLEPEVAKAEIATWRRAPASVGGSSMICASKKEYRTMQVDVETGKASARWLGHGAHVQSIETSPDDAHAFVTTATDGAVRLYDVRHPTPVFAAQTTQEFMYSSVLVYSGGQPLIFAGGTKSEQITAWDVRALRPLYELSTGNNEVVSLAWDGSTQALYAATSCNHVDRLGYHHDYRPVRKPKADRREGDDVDMDGEDEEDEDDYDYDEQFWPGRAAHEEGYFGAVIDAGEHRLYRYQFKEDADPSVVPEYGEGRPDQTGW